LALDLPTGLLDSLFRRGLVTASPKGFRFSHTLFAESLVRSAEEAGRAQALHQAAANTLQEVTPDGKARIGRHLLLAGLPLQAVDLLQEAAELARRRGERGAALARCDLALRAVQATEAADPRRGHLRLLRGLLTMEQGEPTQAAERMAVLADMAQEHGWVDIRGHAQRYIADHLHHCGQHEEAEALLREVAHRCTGQARRNTQGELGVLLIGRGRVQDGIASLERALSIASADPVQKIHDAFLAVYLERARGDLDAARGHAVRGLAMSTSLGWVRGQARFLSQQMWIEGRAGALEEALVLGRDARQLYRRVSLLDATTMDLKIADVLLQLGRIEEAEDTMAGLPAVFASYHREARLLDLHIMGLFCAATRQDTAAWDGHAKHLPEAQRLPSQGSFGYLEQAGDLALTHGWNTRAIRVFGAAAAVLEQMNRPADASRLRAKQNV
jgi:tetratricopeptide (TPR) repeat protein